MSDQAGFVVAPFGINGELEGSEYREIDSLSRKWLAICQQYLTIHGDVFDAPWGGNLSHVRTRMTAINGHAIVGFSVLDVPAVSVALASGVSPASESEMLGLFVNSLRKIDRVTHTAESGKPFEQVYGIRERPLMIVVAWPESAISVQDHALVRELAIHTAGAFFARDHLYGANSRQPLRRHSGAT